MRYPSKVTPFSKSTIAHFPAVLEALQKSGLTPRELYRKVGKKAGELDEYLDVLDCLYALGRIERLPEGTLHYVD